MNRMKFADTISEGLGSTTGTKRIKMMWLSLFGLFCFIGILAVLNSGGAVFSFRATSKSVEGKLAKIGSERTPTDMLFFWHIPRSAG